MTKRTKTLAALVVGIAIIAVVATFVALLGPAKADRTRKNVLTSAQYYLDKGDYGRALDLVDKLLIDNAADADARGLRDKAMQAKAGEEAAKAAQAASAESSGQKAIAQSLDKLGQKLKTVAPNGAGSSTSQPAAASAAAAKAAAESQ
jgi:alkyl sulfatase BDS1-like metallo-beta-lactamase superfamily hydrolase